MVWFIICGSVAYLVGMSLANFVVQVSKHLIFSFFSYAERMLSEGTEEVDLSTGKDRLRDCFGMYGLGQLLCYCSSVNTRAVKCCQMLGLVMVGHFVLVRLRRIPFVIFLCFHHPNLLCFYH